MNHEIRTVVALTEQARPWLDIELTKDCGLVPYLLHRNHGCDVKMVGAPGGPYPSLQKLPGLKMEFLTDDSLEARAEYIRMHAAEIDCLILRGCYPYSYEAASLYKQLNPTGVIYCGLDPNSEWMDRIIWQDSEFSQFMENCDIRGASCKAMQNFLEKKWPWEIHCIRNGFYNLTTLACDENTIRNKKKIMLTVSRNGTWQKATEVLLEAFAKVADQIPEWTLMVAGTVEPEFQPYLVGFFEKYPDLQERILFTGQIEDPVRLREIYLEASVFLLTSRIEGGCPNVIGQALNAGCATLVTKIDAYADAIGDMDAQDHIAAGTSEGCCGMATPVDDIEAYAWAMLRMCTREDLQQLQLNALRIGQLFFDMNRIVEDLYGELYRKRKSVPLS